MALKYQFMIHVVEKPDDTWVADVLKVYKTTDMRGESYENKETLKTFSSLTEDGARLLAEDYLTKSNLQRKNYRYEWKRYGTVS